MKTNHVVRVSWPIAKLRQRTVELHMRDLVEADRLCKHLREHFPETSVEGPRARDVDLLFDDALETLVALSAPRKGFTS